MDLERWMVAQATAGDDLAGLLGELCARLLAEGLALARVSVSMPSVDPLQRSMSLIWRRQGGMRREVTDYSFEAEAEFQKSPIHLLHTLGLTTRRWRLPSAAAEDAGLPLLARLCAEGCTDYVLTLIPFSGETALRGLAFSAATDAPDGFSPEALARLDAVLPFLGLAAYRVAVADMAAELLKVYVGPRTSRHVLAGEIRRGGGQAIFAAILLADMRDFTGLNERLPGDRLIALLNERFEALGRPIEAGGGEILKFMGDSLLAIFPFDGPAGADAPETACDRALAAAHAALAEIDALNGAARADGRPPLEVDVALHVGEVFYGNVGAARRLDFTVIGPAVNETARIERLCDRLGHSLLMSQAFAGRCAGASVPLGRFALKGVAEPVAICAPA